MSESTPTNPITPFRSRFDLVRRSVGNVVYPTESVGIRSAQYLGALAGDPGASVSFDRDGYVVERGD